MSRRQSIITVDSAEVQGDGSWVKVRLLTHGEAKTLRALFTKDGDGVDEEKIAAGEQLIIDSVVDWNWVNDADEALPLPAADPSVVDTLTEQEHVFIGEALRGQKDLKK